MEIVDMAQVFEPWLIAALRNPSPELLDALAEAVHRAHKQEARRVSDRSRS